MRGMVYYEEEKLGGEIRRRREGNKEKNFFIHFCPTPKDTRDQFSLLVILLERNSGWVCIATAVIFVVAVPT